MRRQDYYEETKQDNKYRLLSEIERYEIFNTEEAEKYDTQQGLDFIVDENGHLKFIVAAVSGSKMSFFGGREYVEVPWRYVTKVGANVIVVSAEKGNIKRVRS